jgi:hypothetical protein
MEELETGEPTEPRAAFEEFTSGAAWRSLPLKIKLMVLHLWRAERDVPSSAPTTEDSPLAKR